MAKRHSKVISGIIQCNQYNKNKDSHTVVDCSEEIQEKLNKALSEIPVNAQDVQILSNTYQVAFHNNCGNNKNGITYTIIWTQDE